MSEIVLTTFDWVPVPPRGYVRDLRIRWALEEAGLPYRVETTPFRERDVEHLTHQPFEQVPWLTDGSLSIFESGAILLHVAEKSPLLMPRDAAARAEVIQWLFASLSSVEIFSLPWSLLAFSDEPEKEPGWQRWDGLLTRRLEKLEPALAARDWLAGSFSVADILMSDVLRLVDRFDGLGDFPAARAYIARATGRPAFAAALEAQLELFGPPGGPGKPLHVS